MSEPWVRIHLATQRLALCEGDRVLAEWPVSTALRGAGERSGSEQTPRGEHRVRELCGRGAPPGAVLVGRRPTGEVFPPARRDAQPGRDWILSRVIRLGGCEPGRNAGGDVDTFARLVYIHGAPDDAPMGTPRSHGCIRMRNADVIELFDRVRVGTRVWIGE